MTCCFFGHNDAPSTIMSKLEETIEKLISEQGANNFLVGNQGQFDSMVLAALRRLKNKYPEISYNVVLAYMPTEKGEWNPYEYWETMLPEGLEAVHPRYAISKRNEWMVNESDVVICYVTHSWGGAARYVEMAERKGLQIKRINIAD